LAAFAGRRRKKGFFNVMLFIINLFEFVLVLNTAKKVNNNKKFLNLKFNKADIKRIV